ncbi:MAG: hypothetical protein ACKO96_48225 [Flammeovirgaceae bacterium]
MSQNTHTEQQEIPKMIEFAAIERTIGLIVDVIFPIIITAILTYVNIQIKNLIPYVKDKISAIADNCKPKLNIDQQTKINEYLRCLLKHSRFARVGLYWLNNPRLEDDDIVADSYSLWIEASNTQEYFSSNLSFGFVSLELNTMKKSNTNFEYYKNATSGLICQVWLRHRKTKAYGIYRIKDNKGDIGFILLERTKVSIPNMLINWIFNEYDSNSKYLEYCGKIESIIFRN